MSNQLVVICWMIILINQVASRSSGPPSAACTNITPQHNPNTPSTCPQPCPYSLQVIAINGVSVGPLTGSVAYASSSDSFQSKLKLYFKALPELLFSLSYLVLLEDDGSY